MIQWFSKRISNKKGFTLVELLVVIAILGLLALIGIPRLGAYRRDAAEAANQATAASVYNGAQAYLAKHGNLEGYDYTDYMTGAIPSDAVITQPTLDANGDVTAVQVATNNGLWIGIHPPDGTLGSPGGGTTPPPDVSSIAPASAAPGDLLVHIAVQRSFEDATLTASMTGGWTLRSLSSFKTTGSTADRRAVAIFTKIADGADTPGTVTWSAGTTSTTVTRAFTGANTYTFSSSGTGNNGAAGGTTITINGNAAQGQLVIAAAGYRDAVAVTSITPLGGFATYSGGTMSGGTAWAQAGEGGISSPVVNSASGMGVGAMVVFTVAD